MLIAEIRRKLRDLESLDGDDLDALDRANLLKETKEDLLTADVFGALKYLPRHPYLTAVFDAIAAKNRDAGEYADQLRSLKAGASEIRFDFWRSFPTRAELKQGNTEPDVVLSSSDTFIVVEAKLGADFGQLQIERELALAVDQAGDRDAFLLIVTKGTRTRRFPRKAASFADRLQSLVNATPPGISADQAADLERHSSRILWISWRAILGALLKAHEEHRNDAGEESEPFRRAQDMLSDLNELMRMRWISVFRGIHRQSHDRAPIDILRRPILAAVPARSRHFDLSRFQGATLRSGPIWIAPRQSRHAGVGIGDCVHGRRKLRRLEGPVFFKGGRRG